MLKNPLSFFCKFPIIGNKGTEKETENQSTKQTQNSKPVETEVVDKFCYELK